MSQPKFSALAGQVTQRRLDHLHRYHRAGNPVSPVLASKEHPAQLGIFDTPQELEVFHQYDPKTREVEWAFYAADGRFLLQFAFSLLDRSYQIYSVNSGLFQDQAEMRGYLAAINKNLQGHYPPLELVSHPAQGPSVQVKAADPAPVG